MTVGKFLSLFFGNCTKMKNIIIYQYQTCYTKLSPIISWRVYMLSSKFICTSSFLSGSQDSDSSVNEELENLLTYCRKNGLCIPEHITEEQFLYFKDINFYQQLKYVHYLGVTERRRKNKLAKVEKLKENKKLQREHKEKEFNQCNHIKYGIWNNTMFTKAKRKSLVNLYHHRLASAMMHGQPIILDLSYEDAMKRRERKSLANQLKWCLVCNRSNCNPFNLMLCNVDFESETFENLKKIMPNILDKDVPINILSETYLNLYSREKFVYLTPNADDEMTSLDPEAIYIIGGIVDLGPKYPLTLLKAGKEGIKTKKLPLDRYLKFKGYKTLNIHIVVAILLELKKTGDWKKALENIPRRLVKIPTQKMQLDVKLDC